MAHRIDAIAGRPPLNHTAPDLLPATGTTPGSTIVHIGVGTFHRTHQAVLLDQLTRTFPDETRWGLVGIGLLDSDAALAGVMAAQDCVYSVVERSATGSVTRLISSISHYIHAPREPAAAIDRLCDQSTRIVSMTVTEGGYTLTPAQFDYEVDHPDSPRSWPGYVVAALACRRDHGQRPFTVLSCDNLPGNGSAARDLVLGLAQERDGALADWIGAEGRFPSTMVDRISPATTDEVRDIAFQATGLDDRWPVQCEPYLEWRIEDDFVDGLRPSWDLLDGVSFVDDVHRYEVVKLRLLNLAHQAIAYPGLLLGLRYAHEAVTDPDIRIFLDRLMDGEVAPHVDPPPGVSVAGYRASVAERFANPYLGDTLQRLATDSINRLAQFAGPVALDAAAGGSGLSDLALLVALWAATMARADEADLTLFCGDDAPAVTAARTPSADPRALIGDAAWSPIPEAPAGFWAAVGTALDRLGDADPDQIRSLLRAER